MPSGSQSSSGGGSSGGASSPSSPSPSSGGSSGGASSSSSGSTASLPGGSSGGPSSSLPSGSNTPGSSLPSGSSGGAPGSSVPSSGPAGSPGASSPSAAGDNSGFEPGSGGRPNNPGEETPFPSSADRNGDGVPDTAQPGSPGDNVDFSESSGGAASRSREEQVAVLEAELEGSMRDYDGRRLEDRAGAMGAPGQATAEEQLEDFDRSVADYDEAEQGDLGEEGPASGNEAPPETREGSQSAGVGIPTTNSAQDAYSPPEDIPCANNDDIVARQIREAAMKEKDPDLREAIWEEYRKYKEQANQGASC